VNTTYDAVADWLSNRIAEMLGTDALNVDCATPFVEVGLTSIQAVELSGDLERWTQLTLSPTLAFDYPTIEAVADHVAAEIEHAGGAPVAPGAVQ
jgi:myxalamid-type polyketide synthase MxaE and MxaD